MIVELIVGVVQQGVAILIVWTIIYFLLGGIIIGVEKLSQGLLLLWNQIKNLFQKILIWPSHRQYANIRKAESRPFMEDTSTTHNDVCSVCYKSSITLFGCADCKSARYCSDKCRIIHRRERHKYEYVEKKKATDYNEVQRPAAESRPSVEVASKNSSTAVCHVCYSSSSTRCSRCKAVYYCSGKCQIIHWRQGHKDECVEKKNSRAKKPAADYGFEEDEAYDINSFHDWIFFSSSSPSVAGEGNTNLKPFEISEEATKKDHEQNEERIRFLEEELKKYKNEVEQLKSERDKWEMQTSFVSKRLNSLMREYDEHKIAEDRERRKHDEHIHMLQNECAKLKQELKEERKDVKRLQSQKFVEALMAKRKVKEISEELANACRDVEYATARADNAENKWIMTKRELQEEKELVKLLKMECQETRQSVMRQVEEKELELANALKDVAAAKAKLYELEKEVKSSEDETCAICLTNEKDMAFGCGHMTCAECGITMSICPICRKQISSRLKLFPG